MSERREREFDRNFWLNVAEGAFGAGGFTLFSIPVFLAAWMNQLGAGPMWIGVLNAVWFAGFALPQPYAASRTRSLAYLKPYVVKWLAWQRLVIAGLAAAVWALGPGYPRVLIGLTVAAVAGFTVTMGMANPVWLQWIGKVTPPSQRGRLHGLRAVAGGGLGLVAAGLAQAALSRWPFPVNYAVLFGVAFVLLVMSWGMFLAMTERDPSPPSTFQPSGGVWRDVFRTLARPGRFTRFLWMAAAVHVAMLMPSSFFVMYGLQTGVMRPDEVGLAALAGTLAVIGWSPLVGWMADRYGNQRLLGLAAVCAVCAAGMGWATPWGWPWCLGAMVWSGGAGVSATIGVANLILEYAPPEEAAHYTSVAMPVLSLAGVLSPLAGGVIAEQWGYGALMACALALSAAAAAWMAAARFKGPSS